MKNKSQEGKCLASLAVFRELYNSERDIYGVICEFLKEIISTKGKYQFTLNEITQLLNDTFDFEIPEAIVNSSLNRFKDSLEKADAIYTVTNNSAFQVNGKITGTHKNIKDSNDIIIAQLYNYIEKGKNILLSSEEKEKIVLSFCSFIIDESTTQEYSDFISAFIVRGKQDITFTKQLNSIKEGVVLYTGLKFNTNINNLGSWNTELTIYLETEILFHFAGYNGELYRILFNDFFSLVNEINAKSLKSVGKKLIHLKYFTEIKDEIEVFFKKAEYIISGKDKANPSKTAMTSIIDGCVTPAEIVNKKTNFYLFLKANSIIEDDYKNYYSKYNYKYNIEDIELIKTLSKNTGIENVSPYLRYLNYINIHRKGASNKGFENVGCVLLSGTNNTIRLAWDENLKLNNNVPLASNLSFLTNKLWFKLNKGFGNGAYPKTFDIVTKAQIVLSTQLNDSVGDKFDELQNKYKKGSLTKEQAVASIAELRRQAKKPEEINENDVDSVLKSIEESSIDQYLNEQELFKYKSLKHEEENNRLKEEIGKIQKEKEERERENIEKENELEKFREKDRIIEYKRIKRNNIIRTTIKILGFLVFLISGISLFFYNEKISNIINGVVAGLFGILAFFGIDYKIFKKI
ncbi:MAG: hypothetical protein Q8880_02565 [Bacteroidota bacterium]|nr:hypothetical protein [Bacteroidota bacterium]